MRILIAQAACDNLGDIGMMEAIVQRLRAVLPSAELPVIERSDLRTEIWDPPQVAPEEPYYLKPFVSCSLSRLPYFWRHDESWRRLCMRASLASLGRFVSAGSLTLVHKVSGEMPETSLGEFCKPFDALHIAGGGSLTDLFLENLFRRCCLTFALAEQGKPVILTGQQIGPLRAPLAKAALARALRRADFAGARGRADSLRFCEQAALDPSRFEVMGEDSLGLVPASESSVLALLAELGLRPNRFLAINVRVESYTPEIAASVQDMAAVVDQLTDYLQMPALVVPVAYDEGDSDAASGRALAQNTRSADVVVLEGRGLTPAMVKGPLGKALGAVGVSYHFCTFALSQGVPAVCLHSGAYYSQKAREISGFWDDERLALPIGQLRAEHALKHILAAFEDGRTRNKLRASSKNACARWRSIFDRRVIQTFGRGTLPRQLGDARDERQSVVPERVQ
jgi:polysaccharide pyruvyl transferase WcaK-like protein